MKRWLASFALLALALPAQSAALQPAGQLPPPLPSSQLLSHNSDSDPQPSFFRSGFTVDASGGYKVGVSTSGSAVTLQVWRGGKERQTITAYMARGVAAPERLQATFGKFGKISMRFRESRNRTWRGKRRSCRGKHRFIKRHGVFVGNLRFRGEDGYVSLRLHRARGAVVTELEKCRDRPSFAFPLLESIFFFFESEEALLAIAREKVDSTAFFALKGGRKMLFGAVNEESRGKLAIMRIAFLRTSGRLRINEAVTAASVSPPAPFHGTGRYRAAPDGTDTWAGNLSVNFPGAPRFPLTGPDFDPLLEVPF